MSDLTSPTNPPEKNYCSYLLRLWRAETFDPGWRASLEDPRTGERIGFASLEQLFAYLMDKVEPAVKGGKME